MSEYYSVDIYEFHMSYMLIWLRICFKLGAIRRINKGVESKTALRQFSRKFTA